MLSLFVWLIQFLRINWFPVILRRWPIRVFFKITMIVGLKILNKAQIIPSLTSGNFFNLAPESFWHDLQFSSVQLLSRVRLFATPWIAARQAFLSITNSQSLLKLMSIDRWCHPTISSSVVPFSSCLQSFLASGSFPRSPLLASGGQSIEVQP